MKIAIVVIAVAIILILIVLYLIKTVYRTDEDQEFDNFKLNSKATRMKDMIEHPESMIESHPPRKKKKKKNYDPKEVLKLFDDNESPNKEENNSGSNDKNNEVSNTERQPNE